MRLFHVSEESDIEIFHPRLPTRADLDPKVGLVWAIDEKHLPNFLTPRNCPRVAYHVGEQTTEADHRKFFTSASQSYALVLEHGWLERMRSTSLYLYEFVPDDFILQDAVAGYHVATTTQYPKAKYRMDDLFAELLKRNVEVRLVDNLWDIAQAVQCSTLDWSLCRMGYAQPKRERKL